MTARTARDDATYETLLEHLRSDEPLPVYAIIGEEPFARTQALQALRRAILKDAPPGPEHGRPLVHDPSGVWLIPDGYPWLDVVADAED